jgi:hypothetical protein
MTKELKDLWVLAAWAVFALFVTGLLGSWHPRSYKVALTSTIASSSGTTVQTSTLTQ